MRDILLCDSPSETREEDDVDELYSSVVVELEDEELASNNDDLIPPVESSECEEEEGDDDDEEEEDASPGPCYWKRGARDRVIESHVRPESNPVSLNRLKSKKRIFPQDQEQNSPFDCKKQELDPALSLDKNLTFKDDSSSNPSQTLEERPGPDTVSLLFATEPPGFSDLPNVQIQSKSKDQQDVLYEVLNYCKFLHSAVQRLEQKIDRHIANETIYQGGSTRQRNVKKWEAPHQAEESQLSLSLAKRLGPPWKNQVRADPQQVETNEIHSAKPPSRGKGRGRGRGGRAGRGGHNRSNMKSNNPPASFKMKPYEKSVCPPEATFPNPKADLTMSVKCPLKSTNSVVPTSGDARPENFKKVEQTVIIGSPWRKVWIPLALYKDVFKEKDPQTAVVLVLHSLFPTSTLSCSSITANPSRGIQQLDPNRIEALREFLAEMYPQFDMAVRGAAWAQCLGSINSVTKDLQRKTSNTSTGSALAWKALGQKLEEKPCPSTA